MCLIEAFTPCDAFPDPKFTLLFFFTGKKRKRLFVCGRGVKVALLKTLRLVLCSFEFGIHTMHGE